MLKQNTVPFFMDLYSTVKQIIRTCQFSFRVILLGKLIYTPRQMVFKDLTQSLLPLAHVINSEYKQIYRPI
jgi:hypothetical protein